MANKNIQRGTIVMCDLGVKNTSIQRGLRPCIIVSNDKANYFSNVLMAVPLTSKIGKCYPTQLIIEPNEENNMKNTSLALCEQIVPINKAEQIEFIIGRVTKEEMALIDKAMMIALGMVSPDEANKLDFDKVKSEIRLELKAEREELIHSVNCS